MFTPSLPLPPAPRRSHALLPVLLLSIWFLAVGCQSTGPNHNPAGATITLPNSTPAQIRQATLDVFGAEGYQCVNSTASQFVFEKRAGTFNDVVYGHWLDTRTWLRVKVSLDTQNPAGCLVSAHASRISSRGDATFEEEKKLRRKSACQELLNRIQTRLEKATAD